MTKEHAPKNIIVKLCALGGDRERLEQVGEATVTWPAVRLGDVCDMQSGGTPRRGVDNFYGGPILWAKISDLETEDGVVVTTEESISKAGLSAIGNRLFSKGTILLAMYGSVGKIGVAGCAMATNQAILGLVPRDAQRLDSRFLRRWLDARQPDFVAAARGVTQSNISKTIVENVRIFLPPIDEQRRIADILDKADAIRCKRKGAIVLTEELLRSAFLEMFGEPVTNPKGWQLSTFGKEIELLEYGPRFYNEKYSEDGVRIVRITDLDASGRLDFSAMPRLAVDERDRERYALRPGDVIFARSGATVGKTALSMPGDPEAIPGAYFIKLRFKPEVKPLFARRVLASERVQQIITSRSRQSAQQNFSGPGIRELPLPIPPLALQERLEELATSCQALLEHHQRAEAESAALLNSLLRHAFPGQLAPKKVPR